MFTQQLCQIQKFITSEPRIGLGYLSNRWIEKKVFYFFFIQLRDRFCPEQSQILLFALLLSFSLELQFFLSELVAME
jgi:hypothetical protein